ncbi:ATP-binding cassette domain-containing protein [Chryseosolibacter indicus]|uniref:ATP-binding cassette domain-containing protein n=1 Tax=Chryseosolibacter indicus TaxID=2782351 RepID=A0ABS5VL40_9BACT|nr:ATP-binding cassette domain-containing protein [Chryseosolibacter indicus]MBT1702163.1 ATP-binding cassette domain-containing protein [Chryseosolibacter indicus]
MIELKEVTLVRSGLTLFQNLNIAIASNEHWVITGPSGAGKTLFLGILAGAIHPTKGSIHFDFIHSKDYEGIYAERKSKIHYIKAHALQTFLSDNTAFYQQRYYTIGDERTRLVKDLIGEINTLNIEFPSSFNITALLNLPITKLSNGQLKKVLILKNLSASIPRVLLLDYPYEGLDHESRADLNNFITFIANEFLIQIIIVDHDHELPTIINKRMVINNFTIVETSDYSVKKEITQQNNNNTKTLQQLNITNEPVVEFKDVTIQYGSRIIIDNFNWTVRKGERWALVGRNGSGKTTLFSIIYADHPFAYSQKVFLFGKRRGSGESIWDIKKRISYLGPELLSYLNPQYITESANQYLLKDQTIKADKLSGLITYFKAEHFFDCPIKQLSSSQLQLMLLIQFFTKEADLLLLDEPFQFLDTEQKQLVSDYLVKYLKPETTLILISHYKKDIALWTGLKMVL